jgi:hypothetical protein
LGSIGWGRILCFWITLRRCFFVLKTFLRQCRKIICKIYKIDVEKFEMKMVRILKLEYRKHVSVFFSHFLKNPPISILHLTKSIPTNFLLHFISHYLLSSFDDSIFNFLFFTLALICNIIGFYFPFLIHSIHTVSIFSNCCCCCARSSYLLPVCIEKKH